jgi:hypothetical protein
VNWIRRNKDVRKSALWALISIPITLFFAGLLATGDGFLLLPFLPGLLIFELFVDSAEDAWIFVAQYLGYFLSIYVIRKVIKLGSDLFPKESDWVTSLFSTLSTKFATNSDVRKSALWALLSIPISLIGLFSGYGLMHASLIWLVPFYPAFIAVALLGGPEGGLPGWLLGIAAFTAQYLAYFLFAFIIYKLKKTRAENSAKEKMEQDQAGP